MGAGSIEIGVHAQRQPFSLQHIRLREIYCIITSPLESVFRLSKR